MSICFPPSSPAFSNPSSSSLPPSFPTAALSLESHPFFCPLAHGRRRRGGSKPIGRRSPNSSTKKTVEGAFGASPLWRRRRSRQTRLSDLLFKAATSADSSSTVFFFPSLSGNNLFTAALQLLSSFAALLQSAGKCLAAQLKKEVEHHQPPLPTTNALEMPGAGMGPSSRVSVCTDNTRCVQRRSRRQRQKRKQRTFVGHNMRQWNGEDEVSAHRLTDED